MKKIIALLLVLAMVFTSTAICFASTSNKVLQTVKAMGIMVGDSTGSMNVEGYLTRAQFAKMLIAASGDPTDNLSSLGFSLYSDVDKNHWANGYIYRATKKGFLTGYTDLTFKPDNNVKLEEVCAGVIRLLGYKAADLEGSFPNNYLSKADSLGLLDNVTTKKGSYITRGDCANIFYNALLAKNASGQVYGTTVGATVSNGSVSYTQSTTKSSSADGVYVGVVQKCTNTSSASSNTGVGADITVLCSDGVERSYYVDKAASYDVGKLVQVKISSGESTVTGLSSRSLDGSVNASGTKIGSYKVAAEIGIIDSDSYGNAELIEISDICGLSLSSDKVKYYSTNAAGEIDTLVLNDATGKLWTRVYMISADNNSTNMSISGSYTFIQDGQKKTLNTQNIAYGVDAGGALIKYSPSGEIKSMKNMESVSIKELTESTAIYGNTKYAVDDDVVVLVRNSGNYYASDIDTVNDGDFTLTGWYITRGNTKTIMMVIAQHKVVEN